MAGLEAGGAGRPVDTERRRRVMGPGSIRRPEFNQFNSEKWWMPVKSGTMIIFPSHLEHGVDQNLFYDNRIVIGFNTFVKGNFGNGAFSVL